MYVLTAQIQMALREIPESDLALSRLWQHQQRHAARMQAMLPIACMPLPSCASPAGHEYKHRSSTLR